MNHDIIYHHVKNVISEDSNQIPNIKEEEIQEIVSDLMNTIKSMEKLDRLTIRRTCWESFKDANSRQIIDLCFPAQLGPLCSWPPSKVVNDNVKRDLKKHSNSQTLKEIAKPKDQPINPIFTTNIEIPHYKINLNQQVSNKEIMIKLDLLSQKVDRISDMMEQLFTYTNNGNKYTDS